MNETRNHQTRGSNHKLLGSQGFFSLVGRVHWNNPNLETNPLNGTALALSDIQKSIESAIGYSINLQDLSKPSLPWLCHGPETLRLDTPMEFTSKLPDITYINECLESYYRSPTHLSFPIINETNFRRTIHLAYQNPSNYSVGILSARSCIYAFASLSEVWNLRTKRSPLLTTPALVAEAQRYIHAIAQEETTDGLQATLMLVRAC